MVTGNTYGAFFGLNAQRQTPHACHFVKQPLRRWNSGDAFNSFVTFRSHQSAHFKLQLVRCVKVFILHTHFYHVFCVQPSATQWKSFCRDCQSLFIHSHLYDSFHLSLMLYAAVLFYLQVLNTFAIRGG